MNTILHDIIDRFIKVYIDDIVIKAQDFQEHLDFLRKIFWRMRMHQLKMNPQKCMFRVLADHFLGFLVHQNGIEIDKNKTQAIIVVKPLENK